MCVCSFLFCFYSSQYVHLWVYKKNVKHKMILYCAALHYSAKPAKEEKQQWSSGLLSSSAVNTFLRIEYLIRLLRAVFDICPTSVANPTYSRIRSLYKFYRLMFMFSAGFCSIEPVFK